MMKTYFAQLKEQYNDPQQAYRAYIVGKTIDRVSYCSPNASEDIKKAMEIQKKLIEFAKDLITNPNAELKKHLNLTNDGIINLWREHAEELIFIGLNRSTYIDLVMYPSKLYKASQEITWESLEEIMVAENNNVPLMDEKEVKKILKETCEEFAVTSLTFGKGRTNQKAIHNANESLNQLAIALDCHKEQIGSNKFNIFFDTEKLEYAGYSNQFNTHQKLCINEKLSYDAFAHEWLHGIDSVMAQQQKLRKSHASEMIEGGKGNIAKLLAQAMLPNQDAIKQYKKVAFEKTLSTIENTVERYNRFGSLKEIEKLKSYAKGIAQEIINDPTYWTKEKSQEVAKELTTYYIDSDKCAYVPFMISELKLLNHVIHNKEFNESLFYHYAQQMDDELMKVKMLQPGEIYSTERLEMFARSFETYVDIKLTSMNINNVISDARVNSYTPRKEEMMAYLGTWDGVINEIKETLNQIHPVEHKKNSALKNKEGTLASVKKLRKKSQPVNEVVVNKIV